MHKALRRIAVAAAATLLAATGLTTTAEAGQPGAEAQRAAGVTPVTTSPATPATLKAAVSTASTASTEPRTREQGTLKGQVVRQTDRSPIARARVTFYDAAKRENLQIGVARTFTDADGRYRIYAPPGNYVAQFYSEDSGLAVEYNGNRHTIDKAPVIVVRAKKVTVVSAALAPGGQIDGRAVDEVTGGPVYACPVAKLAGTDTDIPRSTIPVTTRCATDTGFWSIKGLPPGAYTIGLYRYTATWPTWAYNADTPEEATVFPLAPGGRRSIGDVVVARLGTVSGVVTDENGAGVPFAEVNIDGLPLGYVGGSAYGRYVGYADIHGHYSVANVLPGTYRPFLYPLDSNRFAPQWSGGSDTPAGATAITVTADTTTSLDFQVVPAARFDITIVEADGSAPQRELLGIVLLVSGEQIGSFAAYRQDAFTNALPRGSFILRLEDRDTGERFWYDGATSADAATPVTLARGQTKNVTFRLPG